MITQICLEQPSVATAMKLLEDTECDWSRPLAAEDRLCENVGYSK